MIYFVWHVNAHIAGGDDHECKHGAGRGGLGRAGVVRMLRFDSMPSVLMRRGSEDVRRVPEPATKAVLPGGIALPVVGHVGTVSLVPSEKRLCPALSSARE